MLGIKIGLLLVVAVCFSSLISNSYAESISVEFDKPEYKTGDKLTISGSIENFTMPVVALSIFDPNDIILSANNVELDEEGNFSKIIFLDSPFYDTPGDYKIILDYKKISQEAHFTINGEAVQPDPIPEEVTPEVVLIATEKAVYTDNETIEITGVVSTLDSPTVLIGIYDPFGTPAGFYFGTIDETLLFSTSFLAKGGVNFKIDGIYTIKAHYGESETSTTFEFYKTISSNNSSQTDNNTKPNDNNTKPNDNINIKDTPSVIQNNPKDQTNISQEKNDPIIKAPEPKETSSKNGPPPDNLTVEDIELGKILNQINLECDRSKYSDTISYYDGKGPALYRLCKFESSIQFFDESLSKDPNNIEALVNKGSALRKLGYPYEAIIYYDKALKIDPGFVPAINNKANALAMLGKYEEAVNLYAEALGKNPGYSTARQNLELVLSEIPQPTPIVQKQAPSSNDKNQNDNSITTYAPSWNSESQKPAEKPADFFEQLSSAFSTLGSIFGISN